MKQLRILKCRDSLMWYRNLIGQLVPLHKEEVDCWWAREPAGYINIVRKDEAELVDDTPARQEP